MEDTLINRIAIIVVALILVIVAVTMALAFRSTDDRLANIEGLFVGQRETVTGGVANVTLLEAIRDQQEFIKKQNENNTEGESTID